ncbi:hypothetical protein NL676_014727 [Syzygium grande]|nr:hypothetical protein NL676_014727 [Syzygium grande]
MKRIQAVPLGEELVAAKSLYVILWLAVVLVTQHANYWYSSVGLSVSPRCHLSGSKRLFVATLANTSAVRRC